MIITIRRRNKFQKISPWVIAGVSGNNKLAINEKWAFESFISLPSKNNDDT
jgi:hypothetical protein